MKRTLVLMILAVLLGVACTAAGSDEQGASQENDATVIVYRAPT